MNFEGILQQAIGYGQRNTTVALVAAAILVILTILKPKTMMKVYGACFLVLIGLYILSLLSGVISGGAQQKDQMIYKTQEATGE